MERVFALSGLREQKKKRTQMNIIEQASILFQLHGYERTTMQDVANACELGVGTLYNYYTSKSDLLMAILGVGIDSNMDEYLRIIQDETITGMTKAHNLINLFSKNIFTHPKVILRETIRLVISNKGDGPSVASSLISADTHFLRMIKGCFESEIANGRLSESFQLTEAIAILYGVLRSETLSYIMSDETSEEEVMARIKRHVAFLFPVE